VTAAVEPTVGATESAGAIDDAATRKVRVAIVGATGYVGGELIRLLLRHPHVEIVGLVGRGRQGDAVETIHPHVAGTGLAVHAEIPVDAETVFLALPHGAAAERVPDLLEGARTVIDLGPDFRLRDKADYTTWYGFEHPAPELLDRAVYGLPELHRDELQQAARDRFAGTPALVASPGCYATTSILALAPLARVGLIGDLVVDAKSGVSGAGRDAKPDLHFGEVNESVKAYAVFTHRHIGEIEQELRLAARDGASNPGASGIDFLPHLIPMTRGILAAGHVRPAWTVDQAEVERLYTEAYADEPFVTVTAQPPATKHVLGSNEIRVHARVDPRNGRILAIGVLYNLVKGAAGQAIQAFNIVHGLPEDAGLRQLPLAP